MIEVFPPPVTAHTYIPYWLESQLAIATKELVRKEQERTGLPADRAGQLVLQKLRAQ